MTSRRRVNTAANSTWGRERRFRLSTILDELGQDVRWAVRSLARHPSYTVPAVGTLAVALAATAIVASFVRFIAWQPTPLGDPDRTAYILGHDTARPETRMAVSYADLP